MRAIILGDTGSGKTALAVDYLKEYYEAKFKIWCNIPLFNIDFEVVTGTDFIEETNIQDKNFVLIDEVGEISRGLQQFNFGQLMAQSRKSIGEDQIFFMTAQVSQQSSTTMKGLVDYIIYPDILIRRKADNCPVVIKADFYRKVPRMSSPIFEFYATQHRNVEDSCKLYDTFQLVDPLEDGRFKKYLNRYEKYIDAKGVLTELATILQEKEGLNITESKRTARKIVNARTWELID